MPTATNSFAAASATSPLAAHSIQRRDPGPDDVVIDVLFCGVCHSDIHQVRNEWGGSTYPMVPGHEIIGRVTKVGANVKKVAVGDMAGVGCMVDSCGACTYCKAGNEQYCIKGAAQTYNSTEMDRKTPTYGGYSTQVVVTERFTLKIPAGMDPAAAAPLLCAGITTYSPLRAWNCKKGDHVGVVGLGGLGHMAVKLAASMGAEVTMFSTSSSKEADARRLGATAFVNTKTADLAKLAGSLDLIIDTVSAQHDYNAYLAMLKPNGTMVLVGAPPEPSAISCFSLIFGNKRLVGSMIGGIPETQEMLEHCAKHKIDSDIEMI
ncbi:MAG: alcohol dehydrogenase, partial [Myxococcaceae bacterium]|nr:alcohol dehydrogenase [Myxococcaceae bacterium]